MIDRYDSKSTVGIFDQSFPVVQVPFFHVVQSPHRDVESTGWRLSLTPDTNEENLDITVILSQRTVE